MKMSQSDAALCAIWDLLDRQGVNEQKRRAIAQAALEAAKQKAAQLQEKAK